MNFSKFVSSSGLNLLPKGDRRVHLVSTLEKRYKDWKKTGMSRREALKRALMGVADGGFPDLNHRSSEGLPEMPPLTAPEPFEFRRDYPVENAQAIINDYLRRHPRPMRYEADDDE